MGHISNFGTFIFLEASRFDFCIVGLILGGGCVRKRERDCFLDS